jgi:DNA-binding PadR family transcriptional regulator
VLTSLASGPKHGYALVRDIEEFGGTRLGAGTLYGCLAKLEKAGLIEPLPEDDRRRPYRITAAGSAALRQRLEETQRVAGVGLGRLDGAVA